MAGHSAGRVRRLEGALEEPQAVGSGPRDTASTVGYLARGRNATSGLGLALRPRRATTCLGEGWAARAIHSLRVHKREPRSQQHRWTPSRSSAVAPVDHRAWCAEGGCAHTARIRMRDGRGCWWARQHATSVPTSLLRGREEVAGSHAWGRLQAAACSRRARFATPSGVGRASGAKAAGAHRGHQREPGADWRGARCIPRGRGRRPRAVSISLAREDHTTTPRWRARARILLFSRKRRVSRFGQKNQKSATCVPSTLRRRVGSRPTRGLRSARTLPPRRARTAHGKGAG